MIDMAERKKASAGETKRQEERQPYRVRLPGFVKDEEIGLGDVIKRAPYAVGVRPCSGCGRRSAALNRPDGFHALIEREDALMQDEPEILAASDPEEGSPRTIAASANPGSATPTQAYAPAQVDDGATPVPQPNGGVGATMPAYVYAIGRVEPRFPTLSADKEFAQATGRAGTAGLADRQALHQVLSQRQNRYLVRQLCWVLTIEGLDTYILHPRDPADFDLLVEAIRPTPRLTDVDCVVGVRGPSRRRRCVMV